MKMPLVPIVEDKPLNTTRSLTLGNGEANATDYYIFVAGVTDLIIFIENEHASEGITVSIDWAMAQIGHGATGSEVYTDAIGSNPTLAANVSDHWRFGSRFPLYTTDVLIDPYFTDVLPCNWIKIRMYGTSGASACKIWIQGHRQRL